MAISYPGQQSLSRHSVTRSHKMTLRSNHSIYQHGNIVYINRCRKKEALDLSHACEVNCWKLSSPKIFEKHLLVSHLTIRKKHLFDYFILLEDPCRNLWHFVARRHSRPVSIYNLRTNTVDRYRSLETNSNLSSGRGAVERLSFQHFSTILAAHEY